MRGLIALTCAALVASPVVARAPSPRSRRIPAWAVSTTAAATPAVGAQYQTESVAGWFSARAARTMPSANRHASVSRWIGMMGSRAA